MYIFNARENLLIIIAIIIVSFSFLFPDCEALYRDVKNNSAEFRTYVCYDCIKFFDYFRKKQNWAEIGLYLHFIPVSKGKACERCKMLKHQSDSIYSPYIWFGSDDYFEFLKDLLHF